MMPAGAMLPKPEHFRDAGLRGELAAATSKKTEARARNADQFLGGRKGLPNPSTSGRAVCAQFFTLLANFSWLERLVTLSSAGTNGFPGSRTALRVLDCRLNGVPAGNSPL